MYIYADVGVSGRIYSRKSNADSLDDGLASRIEDLTRRVLASSGKHRQCAAGCCCVIGIVGGRACMCLLYLLWYCNNNLQPEQLFNLLHHQYLLGGLTQFIPVLNLSCKITGDLLFLL